MNNRFYLKHPITIEVAKYDTTHDISSPNHTILKIDNEFIEILQISDFNYLLGIKSHSFTFKYKGETYIYWCDVSIFIKNHVMTLQEIRDNKLNKIGIY